MVSLYSNVRCNTTTIEPGDLYARLHTGMPALTTQYICACAWFVLKVVRLETKLENA